MTDELTHLVNGMSAPELLIWHGRGGEVPRTRLVELSAILQDQQARTPVKQRVAQPGPPAYTKRRLWPTHRKCHRRARPFAIWSGRRAA